MTGSLVLVVHLMSLNICLTPLFHNLVQSAQLVEQQASKREIVGLIPVICSNLDGLVKGWVHFMITNSDLVIGLIHVMSYKYAIDFNPDEGYPISSPDLV